MPRFLTAEWAAAFDAALRDVVLPDLGEDVGLAAADGSFTVAQQIHGGPEGDVTLLLTAEAGTLHLTLVDGTNEARTDATEDPARPSVTVILSYDDAVALSSGELAAAEAVTSGRVRVRGDLSVLAAGQAMLVAAQPHMKDLAAATTY